MKAQISAQLSPKITIQERMDWGALGCQRIHATSAKPSLQLASQHLLGLSHLPQANLLLGQLLPPGGLRLPLRAALGKYLQPGAAAANVQVGP